MDSAVDGELGNLKISINFGEIHNAALSKLQKLCALKEKHVHLEENAKNLATVLNDLKMVQMNIDEDKSKVKFQISELEQKLASERDKQERALKEANQLQEKLTVLTGSEREELKNYEAKMKMIFLKFQQAQENYARQQNLDMIANVEHERETLQHEVGELKGVLAQVKANFHNTFGKPLQEDSDLAALGTVVKQMKAAADKLGGENSKLREQLRKSEEEYQNVAQQLQKLKATSL